MAEEAANEERTEEATMQRREDFRRQGQVAQSREVQSVLLMLGNVFVFWLAGRFFLEQLLNLIDFSVTDLVLKSNQNLDVRFALTFVGGKLVLVLGPFLVMCLTLGVMSSVVQVGLLSKEDALTPNFALLDPIQGLRRLLSFRALAEGVKALFKFLLVGVVLYLSVKSEVTVLPSLSGASARELFVYLGGAALKVLTTATILMLVIAALDYGFQRWELEKKMRMTKQEVKEEFKNREGDPQIKARIRKIQRDLSRKRMMEAIPKADVVITNPTHIAVALRYGSDLPAPQIVAMGAGFIAAKIREIAQSNGIPIVENKPLARAMFKLLKVGQVVPRELYNAVAEVLAYVYKLKNKGVVS